MPQGGCWGLTKIEFLFDQNRAKFRLIRNQISVRFDYTYLRGPSPEEPVRRKQFDRVF